ncbi:MAG: cbb3-type cytochrome c oxidase subunit I [Burkholderiaceae bacterium]|nr:cbb3-type cytochrome c oxidase subunit I [Burkholderiaceae bacterium]
MKSRPGEAVSTSGGGLRAMFDATRETRFDLPVQMSAQGPLAAGWMVLGVLALIASGVFSVLLVLSRTPHLSGIVPGADFFHVALVVHVDLSVLVWFVAMAGMLWTINGSSRWLGLGWFALWAAAIGTLVIAVSPFVGASIPIMSNYVPVLDSPVFLYGLAVFGAGFALLTVRAFVAPARASYALDGADAQRFGLKAAAVSAAVTLLAMAWSLIEVPRTLEGKEYYELLFWGPGHVIQFTWTLLMLVAWAWLATLCAARLAISARVVVIIYGIGLVSVFVAPLIYFAWPIVSIEHQKMMTWLMRFGGGLAILPMVLAVGAAMLGAKDAPVGDDDGRDLRPLRMALWTSLVLFTVGGGIGFLIQGSDVRIPAHYHGSIVGVTLALMGLVYALLPRLGFAAPSGRLARLQPLLYGGGQLMHILGLLWSGGYGVQRKVAGAGQVLRSTQEVMGMGLMGLGGLVAIIGGMAFAWIVLVSLIGARARRA